MDAALSIIVGVTFTDRNKNFMFRITEEGLDLSVKLHCRVDML